MKDFSLYILFLCFTAFGADHPSCDFFAKNTTELFKISQSNSDLHLKFNIKHDENCNINDESPIVVFFVSKDGICSIPDFTYIRNNLGFKNYSSMIDEVYNHDGALTIPKLDKLIKQNKSDKKIYFDLYKMETGCKTDVFIKSQNTRIFFDNIYQLIDHIVLKSVTLYKKV